MTECEHQLKPCPFCGGQALVFPPLGYFQWWEVFCAKCRAQVFGSFYKAEDAVEAWNRRVKE